MHLFTVLLHVLHFGYSVILRIQYLWRSSLEPLPLQTPRQRIPHHLAILFVVDPKSDMESTQSALRESTLRVVKWSRMIGVKKLTVYEENGLLSHCADDIRSALPIKHDDCGESEEEYQPPTPPPSDCADSLPLPPSSHPGDSSSIATFVVAEQSHHKHKNWIRKRRSSHSGPNPMSSEDELTICLISRSSSKPAIASAAQALAAKQVSPRLRRNSRSQKVTDFGLTVDQLNRVLEDERGLTSPDFMIIHHLSSSTRIAPPELHGYPPWQIRLTEISQNHRKSDFRIQYPRRSSPPNSSILDESAFRRALDEFASAEMRFGK